MPAIPVSEKLKTLINLIRVHNINPDSIKQIGDFAVISWMGKTYAVHDDQQISDADYVELKKKIAEVMPDVQIFRKASGQEMLALFATNGMYDYFGDNMASHIRISNLFNENIYRPGNMMAKFGLGKKRYVNTGAVIRTLQQAGFTYSPNR